MCERRASSDATPVGGNGIFSCSAIMPGSQQRKCSIRAAVSPLWPAQRRSAVHAESSRAANYAVGIVSQDHPWIVWPASVTNWTHTDVQVRFKAEPSWHTARMKERICFLPSSTLALLPPPLPICALLLRRWIRRSASTTDRGATRNNRGGAVYSWASCRLRSLRS